MKKPKSLLLLICFVIISLPSLAQFSLNKGSNTMDIGGLLLVDYNYRFYAAGNTDFSKNIFRLEDARIELKGKLKHTVKYKVQYNLAALGASALDPTAQAIMDAYIEIGPNKYTRFQLGYGKVPYGFISLRDAHTPFLQKPEFLHNQIMTRRALGLTFTKSFWLRRINFYAGIYNPSGEETLSGINDIAGVPEVISRLEIGFPSQYSDYYEIDKTQSPVPLFFLGLNARDSKTSVAGLDSYHLYSVNGKKLTYGGDLNILYRGFAVLFELDRVKVTPTIQSSLQAFDSTTYYQAGDFVAEISYYAKSYHSLFAIRYDEINPNDLVANNTFRTVDYAYTYSIPKTGVDLKLFYTTHLPVIGASTTAPWKESDFRVGLQYYF